MDPVSQGIVATTVVQQLPKLATNRRQWFGLSVLGFISGMAPDVDIFIRSASDPLLFLEYHRQFTHSLVFIPLGGLLCALLGFWLLGRRLGLSFAAVYLACTLGYATHGLLDACTSYGTLLLWPFSDARIAWHNLPIVDPLMTLPLLLFCALTLFSRRRLWPRLALCWLLLYPAFGVVQRQQATSVAEQLAMARGHQVQRLEVRPSFGNLLVWKSIYQTQLNGQSYYFVDAIHVGASERIYAGAAIAVLDLQRDFPWLNLASQQAKDIERFRWFSNDYLSLDPANPNRIVDMRYSLMPNEIKPFWGITLSPSRPIHEHAEYRVTRVVPPGSLDLLWKMIWAQDLPRS